MLHFERSLLLAAQDKQKANHQPQPEPEPELVPDDDEEPDEEPHPGSIISLTPIPQLSLSPLALTFSTTTLNRDDRGTPTPTNEPSKPSKSSQYFHLWIIFGFLLNSLLILATLTSSPYSSLPTSPSTCDDSTSTPTLRLLRSLGHGAFSAVWLAEDLSRVPLTLVSKKSVRVLRRRVSGRDKERKREKERGKGTEGQKRIKDEEKEKQGDQVERTIDGAPPKVLEGDSSRCSPRKLRDGLKSMLSFSRLPKLAPPPFNSFTDDTLYTSPSDVDLSSWNSCHLPSSTSLYFQHQDVDTDMDLSCTSSIRSSSSLKLPPSPGVMHGDSTSLSRDSSLKKFRDRVRGTRPAFQLGTYLDERHGEMGWKEGGEEGENDKGEQAGQIHLGANLSRHSSLRSNAVSGTNGRLVAVKMTSRKVRGAKGRRERAEEERTRVGFVREVEVLKVSWGLGFLFFSSSFGVMRTLLFEFLYGSKKLRLWEGGIWVA